ncbi:TetR/AcrR family transcriptional regulator [Clostridium sp.]|uniref:TetR/AcrR family transcriptional regulator n=1 Tax=Clostridium sp. TaxID=1506 RepID=UPI002617C36F|nr:TetR/AcrR family transcriptional regulator [Clostridium sp.]
MNQLTERQKQAIATKLRITQIATDLFKKKGFENIKIQDICDAAEISTGAFYHHFKSKNQIINTGYEQVDLLLKERFYLRTFNSNIERIIYLFDEGCSLLQDFGWIFVSDVYRSLLSIDENYTFKPDRFLALELKSAIELAIEADELKSDISSDELTKTLLRTSRGVVFDWCLHQGSYSLKSNIIFDLNLILTNYKK